jgi:hypothetical protein
MITYFITKVIDYDNKYLFIYALLLYDGDYQNSIP